MIIIYIVYIIFERFATGLHALRILVTVPVLQNPVQERIVYESVGTGFQILSSRNSTVNLNDSKFQSKKVLPDRKETEKEEKNPQYRPPASYLPNNYNRNTRGNTKLTSGSKSSSGGFSGSNNDIDSVDHDPQQEDELAAYLLELRSRPAETSSLATSLDDDDCGDSNGSMSTNKRKDMESDHRESFSDDSGGSGYNTCRICKEAGNLLSCDTCDKAFHVECANLDEEPDGEWSCNFCEQKVKKMKEKGAKKPKVNSSTSANNSSGGYCIHNKLKCGFCTRYCIHNKEKIMCRECGGSALCIHDKRKYTCRDCGGRSFCIHNKRKTTCRECGGSAFCVHDKRKANCRGRSA